MSNSTIWRHLLNALFGAARRPDQVYADPQSLVVEDNLAFLRICVRQFPVLNFAYRDTGRICARFECGRLAWKD